MKLSRRSSGNAGKTKMPTLKILLYGDRRLVASNAPVEEFGPALSRLLDEMKHTCWTLPGLGLAAPQVGLNRRLAFVDLSIGEDPDALTVLANPEIIAREGHVILEEGCLSFPGIFTRIRRPRKVTVRAQDEHGAWRTLTAEGTLAQAFCHEIDHLDGILLPDHLRGVARSLFLARVAVARLRWRRLPADRYERLVRAT